LKLPEELPDHRKLRAQGRQRVAAKPEAETFRLENAKFAGFRLANHYLELKFYTLQKTYQLDRKRQK